MEKSNIDREIEIQEQFYRSTADDYDRMHSDGETGNKLVSLRLVNFFCGQLGVRSILDVGCGTGLGLLYFINNGDKLEKIVGVEPYSSMIDVAMRKGVNSDMIIQGRGEKLPFENRSFDAVFELNILHHVKNPSETINEMIRVADKAIFLADANRFAQGPFWLRIVKLFIYKIGLWKLANLIKTGFRGYSIKKGDGLVYSYSVFDSSTVFPKDGWEIFFIPTDFFIKNKKRPKTWINPLLTSEHIVLCAFRQDN